MKKKLLTTKNIQQRDKNRSERGDFFITKSGRLDLADGTIFRGVVPENQVAPGNGEVVFNTGMTGYVESLTDPSYAGQILVFTYPLIGNYGVNLKSVESGKIQVNGVIVNEAVLGWSHTDSDRSLLEWLHSQNTPILIGVDTRSLTKYLRSKGTMSGSIGIQHPKPEAMLVKKKLVSIENPIIYNQKFRKKVILVDCGLKENILRSLLKLPLQVKRVPYNYDYTDEAYDGIVLSNGPGDPSDYQTTVKVARQAMKLGKPTFGICLGSQIMGLAVGAKTYKLKYGHRGHNQPCLEASTNRGYITSQNHGYAIDEKSLPKGWFVSFKNLNDKSVEGIEHHTKPFFSVQFHPEASPGPTDTEWLFKRFYELI
ncbi:MAG TPA: glutamine-hydrolyzing carbamoyl-phosphate synthase small subunit [Candidatus Saccharimonadales bacterium]|nr:glutamine-hydrolyzing carbamoyl-phosphate synthase small subunit [Candidatus Saccharimonadales bacterium]